MIVDQHQKVYTESVTRDFSCTGDAGRVIASYRQPQASRISWMDSVESLPP